MRTTTLTIVLGLSAWVCIASCKKDGSPPATNTAPGGTIPIVDVEGNAYVAVRIGNQWWMAENLRTAHFRDGSAIPQIASTTSWSQANTAAWCANSGIAHFDSIYGKFYNWYAVDDARGLCPAGWHVPSDIEWKVLESTMGMPNTSLDLTGQRGEDQNVGGKMKSMEHWYNPNVGATNESRFNAHPSGYRSEDTGTYEWYRYRTTWWSATDDADLAWHRGLFNTTPTVNRDKHSKRYGFCVRCVMD